MLFKEEKEEEWKSYNRMMCSYIMLAREYYLYILGESWSEKQKLNWRYIHAGVYQILQLCKRALSTSAIVRPFIFFYEHRTESLQAYITSFFLVSLSFAFSFRNYIRIAFVLICISWKSAISYSLTLVRFANFTLYEGICQSF